MYIFVYFYLKPNRKGKHIMSNSSIYNILNTFEDGIPVYKQIAEKLKEAILSGELVKGERFPPEPELAANLGINRMTLRKSLNILSKQNLLIQIPHCGTFVAHESSARRFTVGIIIKDCQLVDSPYMSQLVAGFTLAASASKKLNITTKLISIVNSDYLNPATFYKRLAIIDALVIPLVSNKKAELFSAAELSHIPKIFMSISRQELMRDKNMCIALNPDTIEQSVRFLYELGHRKIAYVGLDPVGSDFFFAADRVNGFKKAMEKYGLELPCEYIYLWRGDFNKKPQQFCKKILKSPNPPTAIVSGASATGLLMGLMDLHLKTPDDLSIIGFDSPNDGIITNLRQPTAKMACKAEKLLKNVLLTGKMPKQREYLFEAELIPSISTTGLCLKTF
ncbi:MAG: GntR family transcriptional regulator [Alphaproteobacteria bacterium]|nr:GntR family transcriptional regulator [Alphaproteobacteria bacterium]